ncbi:MAG TPA: class I SAM-dependent RNA methyltransferase [Thermodesulfobacteriota bacterium]|nr:class I SAM-dependent RNA methyltransferase [Thermodesulfobacteriota bacterium]
MEKSPILITCPKGLPLYLKHEILSIGFPVISEMVSGVETEGTLDDTLRLNLFVRTGHRVLFLIREFKAESPGELYEHILRIEWEEYFHKDKYLCVTSSVAHPTIKDSRFANMKCKDAIVDRFYKKFGQRPDSGPKKDGIVVHLYWHGKQCRLFFDTSGEPLSKRGYRKIPLEAPMQETLAGATILATGWKGNGNFINPMCGSGTLAIEAAMIALDRAPGLLRSNYGFMHLNRFNKSLWEKLRKEARGKTKKSIEGKIIATDVSPKAVESAKKNTMTAGVDQFIEFRVCDFSETPVPEGGGVVMLNPPYGERLGEIRELEKIYQGIGDFFKKNCRGYMGYVFTGNFALAKKVGLRTKRRLPFYNGEIECRLLEYELYEGSKKPDRSDRV